jgi:hypothetical protein
MPGLVAVLVVVLAQGRDFGVFALARPAVVAAMMYFRWNAWVVYFSVHHIYQTG